MTNKKSTVSTFRFAGKFFFYIDVQLHYHQMNMHFLFKKKKRKIQTVLNSGQSSFQHQSNWRNLRAILLGLFPTVDEYALKR